MAIEKQIKTKISLRYLDYNTWSAESFASEKPLKGEVWFCAVPANNANATTAPTMLFKVGDGVNTFGDLKWGSALAADVYDWAKVAGGDVFTKEGAGNVISGITYDQTLNGGKGGFKFSTASVATAEGLEELQKEVYGENGSADNSRIDKLEKDIADNRDTWAKNDNDNTTYQFSVPYIGDDAGMLLIEKKEIGETTWTRVEAFDFVTPEEFDSELMGKIHTEEEIKAMEIAHATAAGKVDKTLTAKVGGETKTFNGSADVEVDVDSAISGAIGELGALASKDKVVEGDIEGTISKDKITNFATEVAAVKVSEAGTADKVAHSFIVNGVVFNGLEDKSITIDAASLGLDTVMHFIGAFATAPTKAFAGASNERDLANGDVYLNTANATEYVYSNGKWCELGNESAAGSHALKTIKIEGTGYMTGGGTLEQDRTIDLTQATKDKIDHGETAYGWGNHANAGYAADADLTKVINGTTAVAKATNADNADKLDNHDSTYFATAESVTDITKDNGTIDSKIAAYNTSKNFGDIITHNVNEFATKEQGDKADTAVQSATFAGAAFTKTGTELSITKEAAQEALGWDEKLNANGWEALENGILSSGGIELKPHATGGGTISVNHLLTVNPGTGAYASLESSSGIPYLSVSDSNGIELPVGYAQTNYRVGKIEVVTGEGADNATAHTLSLPQETGTILTNTSKISADQFKANKDYKEADAEIWILDCNW